MTTAEVLHEGVCGDDHPRGAVSLQSAHRSESGPQTTVVGLEQVVGVDLCVVPGSWDQLIDHPGVDPVPVGGDLDGRDPGPADRPVEEVVGGLGVPVL